MTRIVIVGGGGHAKVLASIIRKSTDYEAVGYVDTRNRGRLLGLSYLGNDSSLKRILKNITGCAAVLGIGSIGVNYRREEIFKQLKKLGFKLPVIVSEDAVVNRDVKLGEGSVVFDGAVINVGTRIGKGVIINTNSTVEHDCKIGNFSHVAPGVTLSGGVQIGSHCLIGAGTSVIQYVKIADNSIIGVGAAVVENCSKRGTYLGVPARLKL